VANPCLGFERAPQNLRLAERKRGRGLAGAGLREDIELITRFELSRIYAQGWNAAGALTVDEREALMTGGGMAALNPWPLEKKHEHERWAEGFGRALGQEKKTPFRPSLLARKTS
jgi:hypothetical protein